MRLQQRGGALLSAGHQGPVQALNVGQNAGQAVFFLHRVEVAFGRQGEQGAGGFGVQPAAFPVRRCPPRVGEQVEFLSQRLPRPVALAPREVKAVTQQQQRGLRGNLGGANHAHPFGRRLQRSVERLPQHRTGELLHEGVVAGKRGHAALSLGVEAKTPRPTQEIAVLGPHVRLRGVGLEAAVHTR